MDLASVPAPGTSRPSSDITSPVTRHSRSRTQSISSDRPSTIAYSLMSPPLSVSPEAAFIAASAASQIVTNDHDSHADRWYDQHGVEPSGETALVSPATLNLVNNFLDQLLFNFLCIAKSTSLTSLRLAVSEVLKPKLAKDAVSLADEELREYLGSGDDDDILQTPADPGNDWDLELVWKRTRLRCMVYSSLGDMEEEDEDYYMEQDQLEDTGRVSDVVSPAVAIFLTSILEFMGEQALIVAGQAAYRRLCVRHERELQEGLRSPSAVSDRIVVEELDMERVAFDRTLGRLWRAWKKRIRSPTLDHYGLQRALSRSSMRSGSFHSPHLRQESTLVDQDLPSSRKSGTEGTKIDEGVQSEQDLVEEWMRAAQIPLPTRDSDIVEIEVPGLALYSDDEAEVEEEEKLDVKPRPKSLLILPTAIKDLPTPTMSQPVTPIIQTRKRSNSLPTPATSPYYSPPKRSKVEQQIPTQLESNSPVEKAPISTEEISPKAPAVDKSPEEEAPSTAATVTVQVEDELDPDATPKPRKVARPPVALAEAPNQPAVMEAHEPAETIEGDIEEFTEEPEVLNVSRVSVAGRISPTSSDSGGSGGRPQPINTALPPPIVEEPVVQAHAEQRTISPVSRTAAPSPLSREVAHMTAAPPERSSSRQPLRATELPLRDDSVPMAGKPIPGQAVTTPTDMAQPIFSSISRQSPHSSPKANRQPSPPVLNTSATTTTKVTIINSPHGGSFLDLEDRPEVPAKPMMASAQHSRREVRDILPPVPERSTNRQANGGSVSQQSIGRPSTERPAAYGRESPERPSIDTRPVPRTRNHVSENSTSSSVSGGRYKPMRTSEESTRARVTVARDFEELMKSDTTIQYTLTPENMRDIDSQSTRSFSNGSPIIPVKVCKSEDRPTAARSRSSSDNRSMDVRRSGSVNRPTPLASQTISELKGPVPRAPTVTMSISGRGGSAQPRDARVTRDSMADFAKWIRSTGPDGTSGPAPPMSGAVGGTRNASGPASIMAKSSMDTTNRVGTSSSGGSSGTTRPKLLAREATVSSQDETSDLIDFIRRGPPSANPRIPRAVAPFRTTMDSDQLAAAIGGKAVDANLPDIRYSGGTAQTEPSINSSIDSRSALLASSNKPARTHSGYGGAAAGHEEEDGMPKRTHRGPRDPYAIDFSDDDSNADVFDRPAPKPAKKEESLAEFLMNYEPPQSRAMSPPPPAPPMAKKPKKKASAPSLMARFTRSHYNHPPASRSVPHSTTGSANGLNASSVSSRATNGTGRGYIPIQVSMPHGLESHGNNGSGSHARSSRSNSTTQSGSVIPSGRKVPMKRFEPREAVNVVSRTNDLADFLKNSGPPGGAASAPNPDPDGRPQRRRMKF